MLESPLQHCMFRVPACSSARMQHSQILSSGFYTEAFTDNMHQILTAFFLFCKTSLVFPGQAAGQASSSASGSTASVTRRQRRGTGAGAATLL